MKQGFLRSSRYSPGNMDRESLETLFVGRQEIMEDVLSRVTASINGQEKHYILLVGPRGSGKTHFLVLAYHRLMDWIDKHNAHGSVAVALLNEEEWGVASYLDFIVRILRALIGQVPSLGAEIADIYERFATDPAGTERFAVELLRRHTRGKTLLLFCENLVDLFHGLDGEGQRRWRATIQEDGNWIILASTPSLFAALTLQDNPFYGFFTIRPLERIDLDKGIELLTRKAVHEGESGLAEFLRTPLGRARARAIHHLASGNHRAYVVLFDFLDKELLEDLIEPFMHMVDALTPYYQDRMRQLPPSQRKIVEYLSCEGSPRKIKDISTPCLMSHQTAAKQIGELEAAGFVSRIRFGRNTYCELSEPLMRICIEVKDNKTRYIRLFIEFLRHWFTTRELERRHAAFRHDDHIADLDRAHVEEAIRCSHAQKEGPFVDALQEEATRCWDTGDYKGLAEVQEVLVQDNGNADDYFVWILALVNSGDTKSAIEAGTKATANFPDNAEILYWLTHAYYNEKQYTEALSAIDRAISLNDEDSAYLCIRADVLLSLKYFDEAIESAQRVLDMDPDHLHSFKQIIDALVALGQTEDAEARTEELMRFAPDDANALLTATNFYLSQDRLDQALQHIEKLLDIDADNQMAIRLRGFIFFRMDNFRRAAEDLQRYASRHSDSVATHCWLADSLLLSDKWKEAIDVADHLLEIDPGHSHAHYVRGSALIELGRHAEGITAFNELLLTDDWHSLLSAASYTRGVGDCQSASRYLERVDKLQPDSLELWTERTRLHMDIGAFEEALDCAARIKALPDGTLLGRLFTAQAQAATRPLGMALDGIGDSIQQEVFKCDESTILELIVGTLSVSVRNFGPQFLPQGVTNLRSLLEQLLGEGAFGDVLTDFLHEKLTTGFEGSLKDWELALDSLSSSLHDLADCHIPIEMLRVAVKYVKTDDKAHLMSLPLEQRQLLEEALVQSPENI